MIVFADPRPPRRRAATGVILRPDNGTDPLLPTSPRKHRFEVQKAEVCEGAARVLKEFLGVFINDLECFC